MTAQTLVRLRQLKLSGMVAALEHQQEQVSTFEALPFIERKAAELEIANRKAAHQVFNLF